MRTKPAYLKPVHTLTASSTRVAEQIKGRVLGVHTEVTKFGTVKAIAVMVDKDKKFDLKSVLVHEAWAPDDQARLRKTFEPVRGKVVSITNAKIVAKGKSVVFFDTAIKSAFDQHTVVSVCPEDDDYPCQLPCLPNLTSVSSISHACMVSLLASVAEAGQAADRNVSPSVKKPVANLRMATGTTIMAAAFWERLAETMGAAKVGQVYRLDWMLLKQEAGGKYSLTSVAATAVALEQGEAATALQDSLAVPSEMVCMSTRHSQTYTDKMKKKHAQADLYSLEEILSLQIRTPCVLLVPACYVLDARGMTADSQNRAWYIGCTQCKRQVESDSWNSDSTPCKVHMHCPQHGANKGRKIYAGSVMLADPSHKIELAVWDDMLRRLIKNFLGHEDMDSESVMEDLCVALKGIELVVRVGVAIKQYDASVSFDLFDVAQQVNSDGCLALYKTIVHGFGPGLPGIVPACCRHVMVNDLGQLTLTAGDAELRAETVKLMVRVVKHGDLKVPDGIDALEVSLKCECVCCKKECLLYAAGRPQTVQAYLRIAAGEHLMAFLHTAESDYKFPVGYHVSLKDLSDVAMQEHVFKWQAAQVVNSIANPSKCTDTDTRESKVKRRQSIESLFSNVRPESKRQRLSMTVNSNTC